MCSSDLAFSQLSINATEWQTAHWAKEKGLYHGESLTKSVIEAMSLGIVPIITDIEGNRGVVIDGDSGWVVPAKNPSALAKAITEFVNDPAERLRRGENARKHIAERFHTAKTVDEYLKLYEKLTERSST